MRRVLWVVFFLLWTTIDVVQAAGKVQIWETRVPVLIEREDNVLFYLRVKAQGDEHFEGVRLMIEDDKVLRQVRAVKLYYGGTKHLENQERDAMRPVEYVTSFTPGRTLRAVESYSALKAVKKNPKGEIELKCDQRLPQGMNFFWVSLQMKPSTRLDTKLLAKLLSVTIDGKEAELELRSEPDAEHRMAVGVRHAGDDGVAAYRIPGIVTTNKGTLLGVYDVRHNNSVDLQEWVDIGLSRSTDGGRTWEKMRLPMSFGEMGGYPKAQNGVGDPSILYDPYNHTVWIVAAWLQGAGNQRAWYHSGQGMTSDETAQLVLTKSEDDGRTWSEPMNITTQVKDPSWYFLLQGPGRGITMDNGTLVFPIQFIDDKRVPNAGVMYSMDQGRSWMLHKLARTNTTESQVVEIESGKLMLNMRDNRGGSRAVMTTTDMGRTWKEHPSSRKALREPVCMASLLKVKAEDNVTGRDLLLFSNPDATDGRYDITIKASLDGGLTWREEHQVMLDEERGWGYTCLTMVDRETVGIFYESSVAHMTFQTVKLTELIPLGSLESEKID